MLNTKYFVVADTETGGLNCLHNEVVELAAVAVDPIKLEIVPNSEFCSLMRPLYPERLEAKALEVNKKDPAELAKAPMPNVVWGDFARWTKGYCKGTTMWGKPILVGHHIEFDIGFMDQLARTHKVGYDEKKDKCNLFFESKDTKDLLFWWFGATDELANLKLDTFREYTGYPLDEAHSALPDVIFTAKVLIRFLKYQQTIASKGKFKGSFAA